MNFGSLELMSYLWIDLLAEDDLLFEESLDYPYCRRVQLILKALDRTPTVQDLSDRASAAWKRTLTLADVRNAVVHNPAVIGWHGTEDGEPDYMGLPVTKRLRRSLPVTATVPLIGLEGLDRAVDDCFQVAVELQDLYAQIRPRFQPESADRVSMQEDG
jgi:hypothetical protein